jgi:hypothetical protein
VAVETAQEHEQSIYNSAKEQLSGLSTEKIEPLLPRAKKTQKLLYETDLMFTEITCKMAALDRQKKNYTVMINFVKRFQMLQHSIGQLESLLIERKYGQIVHVLLVSKSSILSYYTNDLGRFATLRLF